MKKEKVIIITGPSGVGKTSIALGLLEHNYHFEKVITYTTRGIHRGEREGLDYNFISEEKFKEGIDSGFFFEWEVNYKNYFGSSKASIEGMWAKGKTPIFVVDVKGAITFKKMIPESIAFFVKPDSIKNLIGRLDSRGSITEADFKTRIKMVEEEIEMAKKCDYVIINKENCLNETIEDIEKVLSLIDV